MILGLSTHIYTVIHVIISLVAIVSGIIVVVGMLGAHRMVGWTLLFLVTTVLTSVTGFFFPINGFTPALGVGILSLILLALALVALYVKHLTGAWRWIYVATAVTALWFNVFVLIVQSFQKIAVLQPLAPTQSEPPFLIAQTAALVIFVVLGLIAAFKFRPPPAMTA
jgi:phosphoglycerol transferase MdoB-like AlkP superfamily enzyme